MVDEFMGEIGGEVYIYTRGIPAPCLGGPDTLPHPPRYQRSARQIRHTP